MKRPWIRSLKALVALVFLTTASLAHAQSVVAELPSVLPTTAIYRSADHSLFVGGELGLDRFNTLTRDVTWSAFGGAAESILVDEASNRLFVVFNDRLITSDANT